MKMRFTNLFGGMMRYRGYENASVQVIFSTNRTTVSRLSFSDGRDSLILKELTGDHPDGKTIASFLYEYEILNQLDSPGVIRPVELIQESGKYGIVTEDGGDSLRERFKGRVSPQLWILFAEKITLSLRDIHEQQVVHKDICPGNIVINELNEVRLIDFGIASRLERERQSVRNSEMLEGALPYISPEQTGRMNRDLDYRSDYYSLGVTLYKLITGVLPFEADDLMGWVHAHMALSPASPAEIDPSIPQSISQVILKLLAKSPEERYQSAAGILHDLALCRQDLEGTLNGPFIPGVGDVNERFMVPQTVVGREKEIELLNSGFDQMLNGSSQLLLIGGYSGVGKSALVHELQKSIVLHKGFFLTGKYEQYQRNVPYQAITSAFGGLIETILTRTEEEFQQWRQQLIDILGESAQVVVDIIPTLELIIGRQKPAPEVDSQKAGNRQIYLFKQFLSVVASEEHPITLFLDDLQWSDFSSLRLLKAILVDKSMSHCYIIGTYRSNEVDESHHLYHFKEELSQEIPFAEFTLEPLTESAVRTIVMSTLYRSEKEVAPLVNEVFRKSGGNPFFVRVMLISLYRNEGIFYRDCAWHYDMEAVKELGLSDNVVDIMLSVLQDLPQKTLIVLTTAAVIGSQFDLQTLAAVLGSGCKEVSEALFPALRDNLIVPQESGYRTVHLSGSEERITYLFQHDKIQQAAYSLIDEEERAVLHITIGRTLLKRESYENIVLDLVGHFNLALNLMNDDEIEKLCRLNQFAAKKAMEAVAYEDALKYANVAVTLFAEELWERDYTFSKELFILRGELFYMNHNAVEGKECFALAETHLTNKNDISVLLSIQVRYIFLIEEQTQEAFDIGLKSLKLLDRDMILEPVSQDVEDEITIFNSLIEGVDIPSIVEYPTITNSEVYLLIQTIIPTLPPAFFLGKMTLVNFFLLKIINLSLQYGISPEAAYAFTQYALAVPEKYIDSEKAVEFTQLGIPICEKLHDMNFIGSVSYLQCYTLIWYKPIEEVLEKYRRADYYCEASGDIAYGNFARARIVYDTLQNTIDESLQLFSQTYPQITTGVSRRSALRSAFHYFNFAGKTPSRFSCDTKWGTEKNLVRQMNRHQEEMNYLGYKIAQMTIYFIYEKPNEFYLEYIENGYRYYRIYHRLVGCFYSFMTISNNDVQLSDGSWRMLQDLYTQMFKWCSEKDINLRQFQLMMSAELHRHKGEEYDAICCYEEAIKFCKKRNFREYLALSQKLLGKYYLELGKEEPAHFFLSEAYYSYQLWGAKRVCEFLLEKYGKYITVERPVHYSSGTTMTSSTTEDLNTQIDLTAVITASRALSGETTLFALLSKFITVIQESAGAQRIVLLLREGDVWFVEAERRVDEEVSVLPHRDANMDDVPMEMLRLAKRKGDEVLYSESGEKRFSDSYLNSVKPRSAIMVPVKNREEIIGMLYLENRLSAGVFTEERLEVVRILSAQAAVSIENAQIYGQLEQKVAQRTEELTIANRDLDLARKEADRANRAKSDFLANMSHEIRTPMNAVLGFSEIMLSHMKDEQNRHYLNAIYSSGQSLLTLINDILDLSKVEAGKLSVEMAPFSLTKMLEEVDMIFRERIEQKGLQFLINIENCASPLVLDVNRLRQILTNLISNALKFTKSGAITVTAKVLDISNGEGDLRISVQDTGIGIKSDDIQRIFQPFEQAKGQKVAEFGGTGLGLVISERLCTLMNGVLTVQSRVGEGSQFNIDFDSVELVSDSALPDRSESDSVIAFKQAKILIADGNSIDRELIKGFLEEFSFDIIEVVEMDSVFSITGELHPDLIIMTSGMSEHGGGVVLQHLKESEQSEIPIVVITASAVPGELEELRKLSSAVLPKPLLRHNLVETLAGLLPFETVETTEKERASEEMIYPPLSSIEEILTFAECGFLDDVSAAAQLLVDLNKDFEPFVKKIQEFARGFLEEDLIQFLNTALDKGEK